MVHYYCCWSRESAPALNIMSICGNSIILGVLQSKAGGFLFGRIRVRVVQNKK